MNILFLTIGGVDDLSENAVYPDLLRYFSQRGAAVYAVCQRERHTGLATQRKMEAGIHVLRVQTGNITKVGLLEKGISTLFIGSQFKKAINKYFSEVKFDLILYSTPPITLMGTVSYLKRRNKAFTYLMLKDIFPQNAIDIGILKKKGPKAFVYYYFRHIERKLYLISDYIGCMSEANAAHVKKQNSYLPSGKIGLCPNTIDPSNEKVPDRDVIRLKLQLPADKTIFIYGGNFGRPQDVGYILDVLKGNEGYNDRYFIMCGSGTEFYRIKDYVRNSNCKHVKVIDSLNKKDYGQLISACDVGLIFLDRRFTIPNFPSRILDYMNYGLPVLAATDKNTDLGRIITDGNFGWWCESKDIASFTAIVDDLCGNLPLIKEKGGYGRQYLEKHYNTKIAYDFIMKAYDKRPG